MHGLPNRVRDVVGTWGGGIRGLGKGPGYLLKGAGGIILVSYEVEELGWWGLGREKMVKEPLCYVGWVRCPW